LAGYTGRPENASELHELLSDPDEAVRVAALGALQRIGRLNAETLSEALEDPSWKVRRRATELAAAFVSARETDPSPENPLVLADLVSRVAALLKDREPLVTEAAAWSLGEIVPHLDSDSSRSLAGRRRSVIVAIEGIAQSHSDPLCREAAVAALGAIGEPSSLDAVLALLNDKPPIRRRATVALAAYEGTRVDDALARCLEDRDWQVRQAAEDILGRMS
jgi:HEAT repeat protein